MPPVVPCGREVFLTGKREKRLSPLVNALADILFLEVLKISKLGTLHQYAVDADFADFVPGDDDVFVAAEQAEEAAGAGDDDGGETAAFDVDFDVGDGSEPFAVDDVYDFLYFEVAGFDHGAPSALPCLFR